MHVGVGLRYTYEIQLQTEVFNYELCLLHSICQQMI